MDYMEKIILWSKYLKTLKVIKSFFIVDDQVGSPTNTDLVIKVLKKF